MAYEAGTDEALIIEAVEGVFTALGTSDEALLQSLVTPGFYLFEAGKRFDAAGILALIEEAREAGTTIHWAVTEPDIRVDGDLAAIAYVNRGSVTDAAGTKPRSWLESGFLERQAGRWRFAFLHSTRVPE